MRIAINLNGIVKDTGLDYYGKKLVETINRIEPENRIIPFSSGVASHHRTITERIKNNIWEQVFQPMEIVNKKINILHSIKNSGLPFFGRCKHVLTVCDAIPLIFSGDYLKSPVKRVIYKTRLATSVRSADKIIFLNGDVVKDVMKFVNIPEEKIAVIPLGVDGNHTDSITEFNISRVRNKYGIGNSPFILGTGSNEPRKNNITLIKAFAELKRSKKNNRKLVITGVDWDNCAFETYVGLLSENIKKDIIFTGHVNREELTLLYKEAQVFVFPSLYEGFGIPPLEAMLYGTPVITSNNSALPGSVGDAAIKIDPLDVREIALAIDRIVNDNQLRSDLIEKGYKRAKLFTWEKTARLTLDVYKELYGQDKN